MDPVCVKMNVKQCFLCQGETEYYCHSCDQDLCQHCKANHVIDLSTKPHEVAIYREKFNDLLRRDTCALYPQRVYKRYCVNCEIPVFGLFSEHLPQRSVPFATVHSSHTLVDISRIYQNRREEHKEMIHNVRSEKLYNMTILLKGVKSDFKTCHREIHRGQSVMIRRGQVLKNLMDSVLIDVTKTVNAKCKNIYQKKCLKLKNTASQNVTRIFNFEQRYEQPDDTPVGFIQFIKKANLSRTQSIPIFTQHLLLLLSQEINMEDLIELLGKIEITEGGKRKAGNELLLTLMPSPVLQISFSVENVSNCYHISFMTPERVWVSDKMKIVLTDTATGNAIYSVVGLSASWSGFHTLNSNGDLIYIDEENNISKLSQNMQETTTFIIMPNSPWIPQSVFMSPSTGDLLVGMYRHDTLPCTGQVRRYNTTANLTQIIPQNNTPLYSEPRYLTENNNGDVVVSDYRRGVVVNERGGRHRFSYTECPSETPPLPVWPRGICTDALSHILVCDVNSRTVQMINKDGKFLLYLLIDRSPERHGDGLFSLSYDVNNFLVWVGLWDGTLSVYRYKNRHLALTDDLECGTFATASLE